VRGAVGGRRNIKHGKRKTARKSRTSLHTAQRYRAAHAGKSRCERWIAETSRCGASSRATLCALSAAPRTGLSRRARHLRSARQRKRARALRL